MNDPLFEICNPCMIKVVSSTRVMLEGVVTYESKLNLNPEGLSLCLMSLIPCSLSLGSLCMSQSNMGHIMWVQPEIF